MNAQQEKAWCNAQVDKLETVEKRTLTVRDLCELWEIPIGSPSFGRAILHAERQGKLKFIGNDTFRRI